MLEGIRNGGWQPSPSAGVQSPASSAPTGQTQAVSGSQSQPVVPVSAEDINDGTYAGSLDTADGDAAGHISSFLDQIKATQDRFANISPEEKEQTRKRAMGLMQSLFAGLMIGDTTIPPVSPESPSPSTTGGKADTASLTVQWYKQV